MAKQENTQDSLQDKVSTEIVINKDDARNVRDFFKHFNIKVTDNLNQVCDRIEKLPEITFGDQHDFKIALCEAMVMSEHPMFKDELFAERDLPGGIPREPVIEAF